MADKVRDDRGLNIRSRRSCLEYLVDSLRVAPADLARLEVVLLDRLALAYGANRVRLLADTVRFLRKESV